jgi:chromosome partitioning protein
MIPLAVCNHKGGTGKTTTTVHLAAALGLSGYRVLVIDLDPQGFLTRMLGVEEPPEEASARMLFQYETPLDHVAMQSLPGFDLLPSSSTLTKHMRRLNKPTDVLWTREALGDLDGYDVILFDTAAAVTVYSLNALVASRYVVVPVTPEYQPVVGAEQTHRTVSMVRDKLNPDLEAPLFLFTQVDARKRNHHQYRRYLRKHYGDRVMDCVIRTSASLSTSHADGTTVFEHDPYSRGARDYANATDELLAYLFPHDPQSPSQAERATTDTDEAASDPVRIIEPDEPAEADDPPGLSVSSDAVPEDASSSSSVVEALRAVRSMRS